MAVVANTDEVLRFLAKGLIPSRMPWLNYLRAARLEVTSTPEREAWRLELSLYDGVLLLRMSAWISYQEAAFHVGDLEDMCVDRLAMQLHESRDELGVLADKLESDGHPERAHMWRMLIADYRSRVSG